MIAVRSSASVVLPVKAVTVCRKVHDADGRAVAMLLEARMARHGYDLQLTCHASEAWRATFFRSSGTAGKGRFRRVEPAPKPGPACN